MAGSRSEEIIGVIGGSGLYGLPGLEDAQEEQIDTPFGAPSDAVLLGRLGERRLAFLARHGRGHRIPPHQVNYRANIYALRKLGVERVISVSAVGSMKEEIEAGDMVLVDQFFDRTHGRAGTFFERGVAAHIAFAEPICAPWSQALGDAAEAAGARVHRGGTYLCINGPQFSTRGESLIFRSWGVDVIGMTNLPEARLAREAELCYATLAMVTDYDCWHEAEADVSVESILKVLQDNVRLAQETIRKAALGPLPDRDHACANALQGAVMTKPELIPEQTRRDLALFLDRYHAQGGEGGR